jgi:hypothetical protein
MPALTTPTQRTTGWFKYAQTNIVAATEGQLTSAITETQPTKARLIPFRGWRSLSLMPFGTNAENEDFLLMVMLVTRINAFKSHLPGYGDGATVLDQQWIYQLYTTLTCTMGATADGTAGAYITATDFTCDTITASNNALATAIESVTGHSGAAYSPTGDALCATYFMPDLLSPDFVYLGFDMDGGSSTAASANCLVKLDV